jgi:iron complex transport system substrate-binding protein
MIREDLSLITNIKISGFRINILNFFIILLFAFIVLPSIHECAAAEKTKTVIDRIGRTVKIPIDPQRIACFFGPSYEKVYLLGSADKVAVMSIRQPPWSQKLNPALETMTIMPSYTDPDVEKILSLGVDLVFYWNMSQQIEKMSAAGIPVVCPTSAKKPPKTMEQFIQSYKEDIRFYGEVLGEKAKKIADAYSSYYDKRVRKVLAVTSRIPESKRPKVYYVAGRNIFGTQGRYSLGHWLVEMAGGTFASKDLNTYFADASMEQIITWDPDVIIVGGLTSADTIAADPRWQVIKAVKEKRVYTCPEGVFLWGHGSSEVFLFAMWLAQILHPDKFHNLDLEGEVKNYYEKFYHYTLSTEDAKKILKRIPPADSEKFRLIGP